MTWDDIKGDWTAGWNYLWSEAQDSWKSLVEKNPVLYKPKVEAFMTELQSARRNLDAIKVRLPNPAKTAEEQALVANYQALEQRYHALAAGFYAESAPTSRTTLGWLPVLIVGGLAISAAAAAWAVPGYQYAVNLREQTVLASKELDARIAASKDGRTLQPTTLPPPPAPMPSPLDAAKGMGSMLFLGLLAVGGVMLVPHLIKKS